MNKLSKFASFLTDAASAPKGSRLKAPRRSPQESVAASPAPPTSAEALQGLSEAPGQTEARRGPGRPPGKRSNPAYTQTTAHLRRDTIRSVKLALIQEDQKQEFSELVEELLTGWLKARAR